MDKRYSVYERGTDRPIYIHGTGPQCAAALDITLSSFYKTVSRQRHGQPIKKYEIFEDTTDEEDIEP